MSSTELDAQGATEEPTARSGETVERVADELKAGILEGRYAPGQRLISRDIVEVLGVSRSSLREAFRRLEADGLVHLIPNRGAVVRRLSPDEIRHIYQIREALEGYAAQYTAQRINEGDNRRRLTAVVERGRKHREQLNFQQFAIDNRDFHREIVRISGNPLLAELIEKYHQPVFISQLRQLISVEDVILLAVDEHDLIAEAILAGDPSAAYEAMKKHLWRSADQMLARLGGTAAH
ncbi:GntR family transcriptional regulator [Bordetella sp. 02P26C-1]|uniref:GntR family transcriptional regulator n=1 Tax=Bordetella sp. 02P26C-1 TaxID=2683195 RepID=UPI001352EBD0|nr:GntR family transcriptional regulator [Bordetella sp. 02P26C-1]MVW79477.1 FCD domain-containing protein [Bordetella sp. 02P26C-1]